MSRSDSCAKITQILESTLSSEARIGKAFYAAVDKLAYLPYNPEQTVPFKSVSDVRLMLLRDIQPRVEAALSLTAPTYKPSIVLLEDYQPARTAQIINAFQSNLGASENGRAQTAAIHNYTAQHPDTQQRQALEAHGNWKQVFVNTPQGSAGLLAHETAHWVLRSQRPQAEFLSQSNFVYEHELPLHAWEEGICEAAARTVCKQLSEEHSDPSYEWSTAFNSWKSLEGSLRVARRREPHATSKQYHNTGFSAAHLLAQEQGNHTAHWMYSHATS